MITPGILFTDLQEREYGDELHQLFYLHKVFGLTNEQIADLPRRQKFQWLKRAKEYYKMEHEDAAITLLELLTGKKDVVNE